jgi:hypothetical protein
MAFLKVAVVVRCAGFPNAERSFPVDGKLETGARDTNAQVTKVVAQHCRAQPPETLYWQLVLSKPRGRRSFSCTNPLPRE